jgi:EF hand
MNKRTGIFVGCGVLSAGMLAGCFALAQRPGGGYNDGAASDDTVTRMMEFDANKDGKLTRVEVTDQRLTRLFDHADADKDGTVTRADLTALVAAEPARRGGPGGFGPGGFGPGGFGPPGGGPPGGGFRLGDVVPQMFQSRLNLSADQKAQIESLQKEVDARLDKIFNDEQKAQWKTMRSRGPGGPPGGGPGGRRGPGGPGGRGPGGPGGGPPNRAE